MACERGDQRRQRRVQEGRRRKRRTDRQRQPALAADRADRQRHHAEHVGAEHRARACGGKIAGAEPVEIERRPECLHHDEDRQAEQRQLDRERQRTFDHQTRARDRRRQDQIQQAGAFLARDRAGAAADGEHEQENEAEGGEELPVHVARGGSHVSLRTRQTLEGLGEAVEGLLVLSGVVRDRRVERQIHQQGQDEADGPDGKRPPLDSKRVQRDHRPHRVSPDPSSLGPSSPQAP